MTLVRLNYAVELRYGVLVDIARKVWNGEPVDVGNGCVNVIWQSRRQRDDPAGFREVRGSAIRAERLRPGVPERAQGRRGLRRADGQEAECPGPENPDALLSNGSLGYQLFGRPRTDSRQMMETIADWVMRGGESIGKPTHFETQRREILGRVISWQLTVVS